jgi:hypothetical protein
MTQNNVDKWDEIKTYPHRGVDKCIWIIFFVYKLSKMVTIW